MKKLLIGMLITCSLGLVACGKDTIENPLTNNTGVYEENSNEVDSSNNTTTKLKTDIEKSRKDVEGLYTDFKSKVENGVDKIDTAEWGKYKDEFENKISSMDNTIEDASLRSTMDNIRNLVNEYDNAIINNVDIAKDKVEEMKNKIEDYFTR